MICHRIPERTFKIKGYYFPVCSRCTGFYIGAFLYFVYAYLFYINYDSLLIFSAFLMVIPASLDGLTQLTSSRESTNTFRFVSGIIGGVGLAILLKALKWFIFVKGGY